MMSRQQWRAVVELGRMMVLTSFSISMAGPFAASFAYGAGERPAHAIAAIVVVASVVSSFFVLDRIHERALGFYERVTPRPGWVFFRLWTGSVIWMCTITALGFVSTSSLIRLLLY